MLAMPSSSEASRGEFFTWTIQLLAASCLPWLTATALLSLPPFSCAVPQLYTALDQVSLKSAMILFPNGRLVVSIYIFFANTIQHSCRVWLVWPVSQNSVWEEDRVVGRCTDIHSQWPCFSFFFLSLCYPSDHISMNVYLYVSTLFSPQGSTDTWSLSYKLHEKISVFRKWA